MKVWQCSLILVYSITISIGGNLHRKCCKTGQQIVEEKTKLRCEKLKNARLQETFEKHDFLARNESGTCVEIFGKTVASFAVNNATGQVEKQEAYEGRFFPKCCPLNHRYNTTIHGCEEDPGNVFGFLKKDSFVRVGLPECGIISDRILDSIQDVKMNGKDLIMLKERRILEEKYCVDSTMDGRVVVRICENDLQICSQIRCIRKCCPDGRSFVDNRCSDSYTFGINLESTAGVISPEDPFAVIHGTKSVNIEPFTDSPGIDDYQIDRSGILSVHTKDTDSSENFEVSEGMYCIEHFEDEYMTFGIYPSNVPIEDNILLTRWIRLVSAFFLVLTIAVYVLLPKMMNLFGKILISYCVSTLVQSVCLALSQFSQSIEFSFLACATVGYIAVLSTTWSFTWLQIMCIDIWFSFGSPRTITGRLQKSEWRRFLLYSLYGWGFPIIWILMIALFSATTILPEKIRPVIGNGMCFLTSSKKEQATVVHLIYITTPAFVQQIVNTILFVKTILYCLRIKSEIARMNDTQRTADINASKERLDLIMKLAVIMGMFFIFETVSSFYDFKGNVVTEFIEIIWDSINCLQGVFIFVIFICKKKVYNKISENIPLLPRTCKAAKSGAERDTTQDVTLSVSVVNK